MGTVEISQKRGIAGTAADETVAGGMVTPVCRIGWLIADTPGAKPLSSEATFYGGLDRCVSRRRNSPQGRRV
jgi:hypothetical protein